MRKRGVLLLVLAGERSRCRWWGDSGRRLGLGVVCCTFDGDVVVILSRGMFVKVSVCVKSDTVLQEQRSSPCCDKEE